MKTFILLILLFGFCFSCQDTPSIKQDTLLIKNETTLISQTSKDEDLFEAVRLKDKVKVEELLQQGANVNAVEVSGQNESSTETVLFSAVFSRNPEIVELLLQSGADINKGRSICQPDKKDCRYYPLLLTSMDFTDIPTAKILLKYGAKMEDSFIFSAHNEETIAFLVGNGVDINYPRDGKKGLTKLMLSAQFDDVEMLEALLKYGADVHLRDVNGMTALDYAAHHRFDRENMIAVIKKALKTRKAER